MSVLSFSEGFVIPEYLIFMSEKDKSVFVCLFYMKFQMTKMWEIIKLSHIK